MNTFNSRANVASTSDLCPLPQGGAVGGVHKATASPLVNPKEQEVVDKNILDQQYKCFERMNRAPQYNKTGGRRRHLPPLGRHLHAVPRAQVDWCVSCLRRRSLLQPQLGRLVVLGRHSGRNLHLPELPQLFPRL